jgi:hypothetical protein
LDCKLKTKNAYSKIIHQKKLLTPQEAVVLLCLQVEHSGELLKKAGTHCGGCLQF